MSGPHRNHLGPSNKDLMAPMRGLKRIRPAPLDSGLPDSRVIDKKYTENRDLLAARGVD